MLRWRFFLSLPLTLALAACGAGSASDGGPITSLSSIVEHKGVLPDQPVAATRLKVAPVLETGSIKPQAPPRVSRTRVPGTMATISAGSGLGWIRDAAVEDYLNGLVRKLQVGLPQPSDVTVFVSANSSYQAYSTPSREIVLSIGMLDKARSEGEVAAVLAHELSHSLLAHEEAEAQTRQILDATNVATSAAIVVGVASEMDRTKTAQGVQFSVKDQAAARAKMFRAARAGQYAITFFDDLAANYNKREHEFEADLLGTDLLSRSGYQPLEMKRMLEYHMTQWQEEEKHRKTMQERFGDHMGQAAAAGAIGAVLTADPSTLFKSMTDELWEFGKVEIARAYTGDHPSPKARLELVSSYIEKHHGTSEGHNDVQRDFTRAINSRAFQSVRGNYNKFFTAMRMLEDGNLEEALKTVKSGLSGPSHKSAAGRLVAYNILIQMDRRDEAFEMLRAAQISIEAPIAYYSSLASELAYRGKVQEAFNVLATGEKNFASPEIFAPTRIRLLKLQHDNQQIAVELGRCSTYPHQEVVEACRKASIDGDDRIAEGRTGHGLLEQAKASQVPGAASAASVLQSFSNGKFPGLGGF